MANGKPEEKIEKGGSETYLTQKQWKKLKVLIGDLGDKLDTIIDQTTTSGSDIGSSPTSALGEKYGIKSSLKSSWWGLSEKINTKNLQAKKDETERIKDQTAEEKQRETDAYQLWVEKTKLAEEIRERVHFVESRGWIEGVMDKVNEYGKNENILSKDWDELINEIETAEFMRRTTYKWDDENDLWIKGEIGLTQEERNSDKHLETTQCKLRKAFTTYVMNKITKSYETDQKKREKILRYRNKWQTETDRQVYEEFK